MIDKNALLETAKGIIGDKSIKIDTPRECAEGWDSLAHVMLLAAIADKFRINIPINESSKINCLKDLLKYEK